MPAGQRFMLMFSGYRSSEVDNHLLDYRNSTAPSPAFALKIADKTDFGKGKTLSSMVAWLRPLTILDFPADRWSTLVKLLFSRVLPSVESAI